MKYRRSEKLHSFAWTHRNRAEWLGIELSRKAKATLHAAPCLGRCSLARERDLDEDGGDLRKLRASKSPS